MQLKMLVRGYSEEIKWRDEHYIPETINEHLELSGVTVGVFQLLCSSLVGMGDIITKEILDWLLTYPGLLKCLSTFARLSNDIASIKVFLYLYFTHVQEHLCVLCTVELLHYLVKLNFTIKYNLVTKYRMIKVNNLITVVGKYLNYKRHYYNTHVVNLFNNSPCCSVSK